MLGFPFLLLLIVNSVLKQIMRLQRAPTGILADLVLTKI